MTAGKLGVVCPATIASATSSIAHVSGPGRRDKSKRRWFRPRWFDGPRLSKGKPEAPNDHSGSLARGTEADAKRFDSAHAFHIKKEVTMSGRLGAVIALQALILTAAVPAAYAAGNSAGVQSIRSDQMRASKVIGSNVFDRQNIKIGSVQDLIVDKAGRIDSVVVDVGSYLGVGGKNVAVPMTDIKTDNNRLTLNRTKA